MMVPDHVLISVDFLFDDLNFIVVVVFVFDVIDTFPNVFALEDLGLFGFTSLGFFR